MKQIYLIRHGETDHNADGIISGAMGIPLNSVGKQQASTVGRFFKSISTNYIRKIFTSPIKRAVETANIISLYQTPQQIEYPVDISCAFNNVEIVHGLAEVEYGIIEGLSFGKEQAKKAFEAYYNDLTTPFPYGESVIELHYRVITAIKSIMSKLDDGEKAVIVTHHDIIRVIVAFYLCVPPDDYRHTTFANGSISLIEEDDYQTAWVKVLNFLPGKMGEYVQSPIINPWKL